MRSSESLHPVSPPPILNLSVSRLAGVDQAIHKLTVGHYTLDVKVSQLIDRLSTMDGKTTASSSLLRHSRTFTAGNTSSQQITLAKASAASRVLKPPCASERPGVRPRVDTTLLVHGKWAGAAVVPETPEAAAGAGPRSRPGSMASFCWRGWKH